LADKIFEKIESIVDFIKPKKFVGIFFDGVSPKAKMNLQRQRRFREYKKYIDICEFPFNNVCAGTEFMEKISDIIQVKIQVKKNLDKFWENIEVVFSGPNVVGEAEYKIFEHLKKIPLILKMIIKKRLYLHY